MASFIKRHLVAVAASVAVLAGGVGVAIAQSRGDIAGSASDGALAGSSAARPQSGERGVGVPEGPFVDFCPSPEQTEEHLERYGFDAKPTVPCSADGEVAPPQDPIPDDPDDDLSSAERLQQEKEDLLSAQPLPDPTGEGCAVRGEKPDGEIIEIQLMVCQPGLTLDEFIEQVYP